MTTRAYGGVTIRYAGGSLGAKSLDLIPMLWVSRITALILLAMGVYTAVVAITG